MEPSTTETTPSDAAPNDASNAAVSVVTVSETASVVEKTVGAELPPLPAPPSSLLGRTATPPATPSLTEDLRAGPAFDDLFTKAVEGARREGSGRVAAWAVAVVLFALFALRVIFDEVLPKLLLLGLIAAAVSVVVALVAHAVIEARRQRVMLEALEHLTRISQHDSVMRERLAPQIEALIEALRAPSSLLPFSVRKRT